MKLILNETFIKDNSLREYLPDEINQDSIIGNLSKNNDSISEIIYVCTDTEEYTDLKTELIMLASAKHVKKITIAEKIIRKESGQIYIDIKKKLDTNSAKTNKQEITDESDNRNTKRIKIEHLLDAWNCKAASYITMATDRNISVDVETYINSEIKKRDITDVINDVREKGIIGYLNECEVVEKRFLTPFEHFFIFDANRKEVPRISVTRVATVQQKMADEIKNKATDILDAIFMFMLIIAQVIYGAVCRIIGATYSETYFLEKYKLIKG